MTMMMTSLVMMTKMMRIKKRESIRGVHGRGGSHHCCLAEDSPASWHLPFLHHDDLLHLDHVFDYNIDHDDLSSYLCYVVAGNLCFNLFQLLAGNELEPITGVGPGLELIVA